MNTAHRTTTVAEVPRPIDEAGDAVQPSTDGPAPDHERLTRARALRDRAASLRQQSAGLSELLAGSYRRRAAELELEAWIAEVQSGIPYDEVHPAA